MPALAFVVSVTKKMFILDVERGKLVCELAPPDDSFVPNTVASYSCKNFQIFIRGWPIGWVFETCLNNFIGFLKQVKMSRLLFVIR